MSFTLLLRTLLGLVPYRALYNVALWCYQRQPSAWLSLFSWKRGRSRRDTCEVQPQQLLDLGLLPQRSQIHLNAVQVLKHNPTSVSPWLDICILGGRVLFSLRVVMSFRLQVFRVPHTRRSSKSEAIRFAVIDQNKTKPYPRNFVCMLPLHLVPRANPGSVFAGFFGDRSVEVAKQLLLEALEVEQEPDVRAERSRRLDSLEPPARLKCRICGGLFEPRRAKGYRALFCTNCLKRRYSRWVRIGNSKSALQRLIPRGHGRMGWRPWKVEKKTTSDNENCHVYGIWCKKIRYKKIFTIICLRSNWRKKLTVTLTTLYF